MERNGSSNVGEVKGNGKVDQVTKLLVIFRAGERSESLAWGGNLLEGIKAFYTEASACDDAQS